MKAVFKNINPELIFWTSSLMMLAMINPGDKHFSFCLLNLLGFSWCPGCGIGHSISHLLHGNIAASLNTHVLGIFALAVIAHRIFILSKNQFHIFKTNSN